MSITLYSPTATESDFITNGLGFLPDATKCVVKEERNGEFELELEYPEEGMHFHDISLRSIIKCKSNPYSNPQLFRVYDISIPLNGIVSISAAHISYDLSGIVDSPFEAENLDEALTNLTKYATTECPFRFHTTKLVNTPMYVDVPSSVRSLLGGQSGSLLDVYGGEYEFDNFDIHLTNHRGSDNGVLISYGKNLTSLKQDKNCESVYTGVYPFFFSEDEGLLELEEKIIPLEGEYDFTRILAFDTTDHFIEMPSEESLRSYTNSYIKNNKLGVPKVSLEVSFVQLAQASGYEDYKLLEQVRLCDTVTVRFEKFKIDTKAKCIKTEYDVLTDKYKKITLGEASTNLTDSFISQSEEIKNAKSAFETDIEKATKLITGNLGGYVILHSSTNDTKRPDEILIMDEPDIKDAKRVWRWNKAGLGYSSTGYNGPYGLAMTADGQIVADYITAGTMSANQIKGGVLTLGDMDNNAGSLEIKDEDGNIIGKWDKDGIMLDPNSTTRIAKNSVTSAFIAALGLQVGVEIMMGPDAKISWDNIDDAPTFTTSEQVTQITRNTVTTAYVNALAVKAGSVDAETITGSTMTGIHVRGARLEGNGVEVFGDDGIGIPHVDFHYNGSQADYTARIQELQEGKLVAVNSISNFSDERLKKDIVDLDDRYTKLIDNVSPKQYRFKKGDELLNLGFIAQEVDNAMDEIGITDKAIVFNDGTEEGYFSLDYNQLIPILWRKIQILQDEINTLKQK